MKFNKIEYKKHKRLFSKLFIMLIIVAAVFIIDFTLNLMAINQINGDSSTLLINKHFKYFNETDFDLLILGNSRLFRGMAPEKMSIPSYNFAYNGDSFKENYFKLLYSIDQGKKPAYLLVSIDYFQFSFVTNSLNYSRYFRAGYLTKTNDNPKSPSNFEFFIEKTKKLLDIYLLRSRPILLEYSIRFLKGESIPQKPYIAETGQYITYKIDRNVLPKEYDLFVDSEALLYLKRIVELADTSDIKAFYVIHPIHPVQQSQYSEQRIREFSDIINAEIDSSVFMDLSKDSRFSAVDFADEEHLTTKSSEKLTRIIDNWISSKIE